MKYLSLFSGIGGFELGIQYAYEDYKTGGDTSNSEQKSSQYAKGDKPIFERQEESDNSTDNESIRNTKDSSGALLSDRQEQVNTKSRDLEEVENNTKTGQEIRQSSDELLSERSNLRNKQKILQHEGNKPNTRSEHKQPTCIGYSEIDKYAISIYEKHFPNHKNFGDITQINAKELPEFDLLVGGVPCQSWSIAGKRGGFDDERGNMWFECFKILRAKQPKHFLFENVKGLLSHDGGKSMERICEELCECGYAIDFEVLNSKNFGVPQNRERVFIIGIRLDLLDSRQIF